MFVFTVIYEKEVNMFGNFDEEIEYCARKTSEELDKVEGRLEQDIKNNPFTERLYNDNKLSELAEYLTANGKGLFRFNGKLLIQFSKYSSFVYSYVYGLKDYEVIVLQRPMDCFGNEKFDDVANDLSKHYVKFMAKTYPDYKNAYLDYKHSQEVEIFEN